MAVFLARNYQYTPPGMAVILNIIGHMSWCWLLKIV